MLWGLGGSLSWPSSAAGGVTWLVKLIVLQSTGQIVQVCNYVFQVLDSMYLAS